MNIDSETYRAWQMMTKVLFFSFKLRWQLMCSVAFSGIINETADQLK